MPKERRTTERSHRASRARELFSSVDGEGPLQGGLIISRFGQQADVQTDTGTQFRCHLRKHMAGAAVGDRIEWQADHDEQGVVVNILPRRSALQRPNPYEGLKTIAANVDHLLIVVAPVPALSELLLDRYLVAAEATGIPASIVINKADLLDASQHAELLLRLQPYRQLDYPLLLISTRTGLGMEELRTHISDGASVIIGQSGVGKSSLVNALLPDAQMLIGDVSESSDLGQHTTTAARLFFLPGGGSLIDSPGVREFGLWHLDEKQIAAGFRDIQHLSAQCKFRNCRHRNEPGCAVRAAIGTTALPSQRYENFCAIVDSSN